MMYSPFWINVATQATQATDAPLPDAQEDIAMEDWLRLSEEHRTQIMSTYLPPDRNRRFDVNDRQRAIWRERRYESISERGA